jgi:hypothetical protein
MDTVKEIQGMLKEMKHKLDGLLSQSDGPSETPLKGVVMGGVQNLDENMKDNGMFALKGAKKKIPSDRVSISHGSAFPINILVPHASAPSGNIVLSFMESEAKRIRNDLDWAILRLEQECRNNTCAIQEIQKKQGHTK